MRNLGLLLALWSVILIPTNSLALGLGEIEVKSFLNQPLNAEIEVISARLSGSIDFMARPIPVFSVIMFTLVPLYIL